MRFKVDIPFVETQTIRYEVEARDEDHAVTLALDESANLDCYIVDCTGGVDEENICVETEARPLNLVDYQLSILKRHRRIVV